MKKQNSNQKPNDQRANVKNPEHKAYPIDLENQKHVRELQEKAESSKSST